MSAVNEVLFENGKATPLFLARWRAKGGLIPLSPVMQLTVDGKPTVDFAQLWRAAFPSFTPLSGDPIHDESGRPTVAFIRVWR